MKNEQCTWNVVCTVCRGDRPPQGRPKAPPATQNASQKSLGDKNKEVRGDKTYLFVLKKIDALEILKLQ